MYHRGLTTRVRTALTDTPVVLVNGPRQSGKSTLVRDFGAAPGTPYLTLDDPLVRAQAAADPDDFLAAFNGPVVLDEVQYVPELFRAMKLLVDRQRTPGRFLLTGSANVLLLPGLAQWLVGRMEIQTLWPLSQREISATPGNFIEAVFAAEPLPLVEARLDRSGVMQRALVGGFPEAVQRTDDARREAWFGTYVTMLMQRDLRDLSNIAGALELPRLLQLLAARAAGLQNQAELSRTSGLPYTTLLRYLTLLRLLFLINLVPAWQANLGKRLVKAPKLMFTDTGLLAHLLGQTTSELHSDAGSCGPLLENFVYTELLRQASWSTTRADIFHYRSAGGEEVDLVLEGPGGKLVALEVKAGSAARREDSNGLRAFAAAVGPRLARGILLHTGQVSVPIGPNLWAMPVESLWTLGAA